MLIECDHFAVVFQLWMLCETLDTGERLGAGECGDCGEECWGEGGEEVKADGIGMPS